MNHTEIIATVDLIAVILSFLSFVFASFLCILLWRVRRKQIKSTGKRSVILLTTHVYYMAICDVLISIWCIFTYGPAVLDTNFSFFIEDPLEDEMNTLSFSSILSNLPCFLLAILGQFAAIGSATWYLMISYCLWRILYGHNPLSITMKKIRKSPNTNISNTKSNPLNNNINKRNLKFTKSKSIGNPPSKKIYKILPVKEEESMGNSSKSDNDALSPNKFLNLPKMLTYTDDNIKLKSPNNIIENKSVGSDHIKHQYTNSNTSTISIWSAWSSSNMDVITDELRESNKEYQIREKQEMSKILRRHHIFVWSITILLTLVPFSTKSMGIDVAVIGDTERKLECWIGSKFWAFSFYSVISIAVLSAICMLLFISFKILSKKYKQCLKEYIKHKKQKKRDELIKIYNSRGSDITLDVKNERGSSGISFMNSLDSTNRTPLSYYKKETMILKRFGVFVGCYLLCWIIPIIRRYYAIFVINESLVPDWLYLGSEITIALFPMANAFVWYTNPSFRKLISKNLNITIRYNGNCICSMCCCCCYNYKHKHSNITTEIIIDKDANNNTQLTEYDNTEIHRRNKLKVLKEKAKSTGGISGHTTPTTYGSFCDIVDMTNYSRFSWPKGEHKSMLSEYNITANTFPKFKGHSLLTNISNGSDCNSSDNTDFDGYKNDNNTLSSENSNDDNTLSSGGTIDDNDIERFKKYSMEQLVKKVEKIKKKKIKINAADASFSSMIAPSPTSRIQKYSS
eukprot:197824_1